eukprot:CAMPEP_0180548460 /NCGR_PEP_ID=MMETSP1036_2-20121128/71621_1 /TAXON_ID=632150 /ORGANISM="Azadinium spinosum, Strain 3D9" /LENGTH=36 /DNA_ID= /DNA_START= /DNA_END= /DNA_ORIENTATION=
MSTCHPDVHQISSTEMPVHNTWVLAGTGLEKLGRLF